MAGTSLREEKDDALGFAPAVRNLGESGVRGSPGEETFAGAAERSKPAPAAERKC